MNLIDLLRNQHREVTELLERLQSEDDRKERKEMLTKVAAMIRAHLVCEEKMIYPLAARSLDDDKIVIESIEEHAMARIGLEQLEATSAGDKRFSARAKVLCDLISHHVEEEERELLPQLDAKLSSDELERLGDRFEKRFDAMVEEGAIGPGKAARRGARGRTARGSTARTRGARTRGTRSTGTRAASTRTKSTQPKTARKGGTRGTTAAPARGSKGSTTRRGSARPRRGESSSRG